MARDTHNGETFSFVTGLIVGLIVSTPLAAWLSPRSGDETRASIRQRGIIIRRKAAEAVRKPVTQVQDAVEQLRGESIQEALEAGKAIAAGKRAGNNGHDRPV